MDVDLDLSTLKIQEKDKKRPYSEAVAGINSSLSDGNRKTAVKPLLRRSERNKIRSLEACDNRRVVKKPKKLSVKVSIFYVIKCY